MADSLLPLAWDIQTRDGTLATDSKMGNVVVQKTPTGHLVQKRHGLQLFQTQGAGNANGGFFQGYTPWVIINATLYIVTGTTSAGIPIPGGTNSPYSSSSSHLLAVFHNGLNGWTFNGATISSIAAFPGSSITVPGIACLDSTYYVLVGQVVYASAYGDPTTWPGLNTVTLNPDYGAGVAIALHLSYVVAFMETGTQFFYDAGVSPGAPIAQVPNATVSIGCAFPYSIASSEDVLYFGAVDQDGSICIGIFNGLQFSRISTPAIDRILNLGNYNAGDQRIQGNCTVCQGKPVYLLTIPSLNLTLCYDIQEGLWDYWSSVVAGVEGYFRGSFFVPLIDASAVSLQFPLCIDQTQGLIYKFTSTSYQDNGQPIRCFIRTQPDDAGTYAVKFCAGVYLHSDTISTTVSVTYSNDDYQTFAVSRTIDMSTQKKQLIRVGSYRHRSWDLLHTDNTPFRVASLELDLTDTGEGNQ